MTGDTKTAMKNIPTSIIDKVKAYDQKSDLARVTGIDVATSKLCSTSARKLEWAMGPWPTSISA